MKSGAHIVNRYQIIDKLGQGGMGVVYKVYDRLEKQNVALKQVLLPERQLDFASQSSADDVETLRLNLAQEFSILATLRHPHILSVLDYGFDFDGQPFYTMNLLEEGRDFKSYVQGVSLDKQIDAIAQVLQALHYLHRRGILHRDLKPENVFITKDGQVKVMDFGLARKFDQDTINQDVDDTMNGTIAYMSSELFFGKAPSIQSDLWAVGIMAVEAFISKFPFGDDSPLILIRNIMYDAPNLAGVPDDLQIWVGRLLDKTPKDRYPTAQAALAALYECIGQSLPPESATTRESFLAASTFVGREQQFADMVERLKTLKQQDKRYFLIGGESGVGKSRFVQELIPEALVRGIRVLRGQATDGSGLPFQIWRSLLPEVLLSTEIDLMQARILKEIVPDIAKLLGYRVPDAPELLGVQAQERLIKTIVEILQQSEDKFLLVMEDLHWSQEDLLPFKRLLAVNDRLKNIMVIATYRNDEHPDLPDKLDGVEVIELERLKRDDIYTLSKAIVGNAPNALLDLVESQTEGNALFIVEVMRSLAEDAGRLSDISTLDLPENVFTERMKNILGRRLAQVPEQYQPVMPYAAVYGRQIDEQILREILPDLNITDWLYQSETAAVLSVQGNQWRFAHDKLREHILGEITPEQKPSLHRQVALAIETIHPDNSDYNETLLEHWYQAKDFEKEFDYLDKVIYRLIHLRPDYKRAEQLIDRSLPNYPETDTRHAELLLHKSRVVAIKGQYALAEEMARKVIAFTRQDTETVKAKGLYARSLYSVFNSLVHQQRYDEALTVGEQAIETAEAVGNREMLAFMLNGRGALTNLIMSEADAVPYWEKSYKIYEELGNPKEVVLVIINLTLAYANQERYEEALELVETGLRICNEYEDDVMRYRLYIRHNVIELQIGEAKYAQRKMSKLILGLQQKQYEPVLLHAIACYALILLEIKQVAEAAKVVGFLRKHPASGGEVHYTLREVAAKMDGRLDETKKQQYMTEGEALSLSDVIDTMIVF